MAHGAHAVGADASADADDQGVAPAGAEIAEPCPTGEFLTAEHSAAVGSQDFEHGSLLSCQALEGVSRH